MEKAIKLDPSQFRELIDSLSPVERFSDTLDNGGSAPNLVLLLDGGGRVKFELSVGEK